MKNKLSQLHSLVGHPIKIEVDQPKPKVSTNVQTAQPRRPLFSVVMRGVEHDVSMDDIRPAAQARGISIHNLWRIRSRATNLETTLVRILLYDPTQATYLIRDGLPIFFQGVSYRCEESQPRRVQCSRCFGYGHTADTCSNQRLCAQCSLPAGPNHNCASDPTCVNCGKHHPPTDPKCPAKSIPPSCPSDAQPIKPVSSTVHIPPTLTSSQTELLKICSINTLHFLSEILLELFPNDILKVQSLIRKYGRRHFNFSTSFSWSGNAVHISHETLV